MAPEQSADASGVQVLPDRPTVRRCPSAAGVVAPIDDPMPSTLPDTRAVVGDSLTESAQQEIGAYLNGLGVDIVTIDGASRTGG